MSAKPDHLRTLAPRLRSAIETLTWPHHTYINNTHRTAPSLYHQLLQAIPGAQGAGGNNGYRSMPVLWIDAVDTLKLIDYTVTNWLPLPNETTQTRLHALHRIRSWKQHDTDFLTDATQQLGQWCERIDNLLDPKPTKTLSAPCPQCNATHTYRQDSGGDTVRIAALQITARGCVCQACKASWAPDLYSFLAHQLLGFDLPEGVLA